MVITQEVSERHKKELEEFLEVCEKGKNKNLEGFDIYVSFQTGGLNSAAIRVKNKNRVIAIIQLSQYSSFRIVKDGQTLVVNSIDNRFIDRLTNGEKND